MKPKSNIKTKKYLCSIPVDLWNKFDKINKDSYRQTNASIIMLITDFVNKNK